MSSMKCIPIVCVGNRKWIHGNTLYTVSNGLLVLPRRAALSRGVRRTVCRIFLSLLSALCIRARFILLGRCLGRGSGSEGAALPDLVAVEVEYCRDGDEGRRHAA